MAKTIQISALAAAVRAAAVRIQAAPRTASYVYESGG